MRAHGQPSSPRSACRSRVAIALLLAYLAVLLLLTSAPNPRDPVVSLNLVPLRSIRAGVVRGGWLFYVNVIGNVLAFVPLGGLLPLWKHGLRRIGPVMMLAAVLSSTIEILQRVYARRVSDVDDILLNVSGALLGLLCYRMISFGRHLVRKRIGG